MAGWHTRVCSALGLTVVVGSLVRKVSGSVMCVSSRAWCPPDILSTGLCFVGSSCQGGVWVQDCRAPWYSSGCASIVRRVSRGVSVADSSDMPPSRGWHGKPQRISLTAGIARVFDFITRFAMGVNIVPFISFRKFHFFRQQIPRFFFLVPCLPCYAKTGGCCC